MKSREVYLGKAINSEFYFDGLISSIFNFEHRGVIPYENLENLLSFSDIKREVLKLDAEVIVPIDYPDGKLIGSNAYACFKITNKNTRRKLITKVKPYKPEEMLLPD